MMDNLRYETASYISDLLEEIILLARRSGVAGVRSDGVYPVLRALENGCLNRPSHIAEELSVAPPTMSVRLNEMYDQGLIMKFTDRKDARSYFVEITRKGQELLESEKNRRISKILEYIAYYSDDEVQQIKNSSNIIKLLLSRRDV